MAAINRVILVLTIALVFAGQVSAGTWTGHDFLYKPALGARGAAEKNNFDSGLDKVDARLGKEIWVGDPGYGTTLQDAVSAIAGNNAILRVPAGTYNIALDLTIPGNITLKPDRGAILTRTGGSHLTINGSLEAGLYRIFNDTSTGHNWVVLGNAVTTEVYPQWWGAKGDGITADLAALQAAIHSGAKVVTFLDTGLPYLVNDATDLVSNQEIRLLNRATIRTTYTSIPIKPIFNLGGNEHDIIIRGGILEGTNTSGIGIFDPTQIRGLINYTGGTNPYNVTVEGVEIRNSFDAGISIAGSSSTGIKIIRCHIHHCAEMGVAAPSGDIVIQDCDIHDNQHAGVDAGGFWTYGSLKILHNRIYRNGGVNGGGGQDGGSWSGILLNGTRRALVQGNHVYANGVEGIRVDVPWLSCLAQNLVIENNLVYDQVLGNAWWTPAGIRVTGGKNIQVTNNNSYGNYDNYIFQPRDSGDGFVGLESVIVKSNISANAGRYGFWVNRPGSLKTDPGVPVGEVFRGLIFQGNISDQDTIPYQADTYGSFWGRDNVTIAKTETLGAELVVNGDFEAGNPPTNWTAENACSLSRVTDNRPGSAGTDCVEVTKGNPGSCAYSQAFALTAGQTYKLAIWVKRITEVHSSPRVSVAGPVPWPIISWWDNPEELPVNTWKEHVAYFIPGNSGDHQIKLYGEGDPGTKFRFDDISVQEVTSLPVIGDIH